MELIPQQQTELKPFEYDKLKNYFTLVFKTMRVTEINNKEQMFYIFELIADELQATISTSRMSKFISKLMKKHQTHSFASLSKVFTSSLFNQVFIQRCKNIAYFTS
jgi:hypothetical protein